MRDTLHTSGNTIIRLYATAGRAGARGNGIGRALLERSLTQFWATGIPGVHLSTTDLNVAACHLYESVGFRLLHAWTTRLWRGLVAGPVQRRVYGILHEWA